MDCRALRSLWFSGVAVVACLVTASLYGQPLELLEVGGPRKTPASVADVPSFKDGNLARAPDAVFFNSPHRGGHVPQFVNDGAYGDSYGILFRGLPTSGEVYCGVYWTEGPKTVAAIALGRDNKNHVHADRAVGAYTIQFTTDEFIPVSCGTAPACDDSAQTAPAVTWKTIGTAEAHVSQPGKAPSKRGVRRHYRFPEPVLARGVRVLSAVRNVIDEMELAADTSALAARPEPAVAVARVAIDPVPSSDRGLGTENGLATDIGDRLELFVDRHLIESMTNLRLALHPPEPREIALRPNRPWEGKGCAFFTVFKDDDRYRMYYRGSGTATVGERNPLYIELTCYAESQDGIEWTRPSLGLFEFNGSKDNNIIWMPLPGIAFGKKRLCQNWAVFKDSRPGVPDDQKYKAMAGMPPRAFASADGIRFRPLSDEPIITKGSFDSQNIAFWDEQRKKYFAYFRIPHDRRFVATCTSDDYLHWTDPKPIDVGDTPREHLYTNATRPYFRAPHIFFSFPKRFIPSRHTSDAIFMSSRDGLRFERTFLEALIRPGRDQLNWGDKSCLPAWGLVQTAPDEMSVYYTQNYWKPTLHLRRGVFRLDGIASARADRPGGELITKPIRFSGRKLVLNFATSAAGNVRVELQDATGTPYPGFELSDAPPLYGDKIAEAYAWTDGTDVSSLAGNAVRLRFQLMDADLYSYRFEK